MNNEKEKGLMIPTSLKHRPIVCVEGYRNIDGPYPADETDARGLDVGFAQWYGHDLSAKVWRYIDDKEKWSRQSEELPLHRVLDLSILVAKTAQELSKLQSDGQVLGLFPSVQDGKKPIQLTKGKEADGADLKKSSARQFLEEFEKEKRDYLDQRFSVLAEILRELGY